MNRRHHHISTKGIRVSKLSHVRPVSQFLAIAFGLLVALVLAAAPASARLVHKSLGPFGALNQPTFATAASLAVNQATGDLLVLDVGEGKGTLSRYHEDGTPADFAALGTNVIPIAGLENASVTTIQVAVDSSGGPADGNIYIAVNGGPVDVIADNGTSRGALTESSEGPFGFACGVAVDPAGSIYVADGGSSVVHKFVPTGNLPTVADNTANFSVGEAPCQTAAGGGLTAGSLFTIRLGQGGELVKVNSEDGTTDYTLAPGHFETVAVNPAPSSGHVFASISTKIEEFDASGAFEASLRSSFKPGGNTRGLAVNESTGNIYVATEGSSQVSVWSPALIVPDVASEPSTQVNETTVLLHGTISAAEGPSATCEFQYTTEAAFDKEGFAGASLGAVRPAGSLHRFG